jgi:hypothetical protein
VEGGPGDLVVIADLEFPERRRDKELRDIGKGNGEIYVRTKREREEGVEPEEDDRIGGLNCNRFGRRVVGMNHMELRLSDPYFMSSEGLARSSETQSNM